MKKNATKRIELVQKAYNSNGIINMNNGEYSTRVNNFLEGSLKSDIGKGDISTELIPDSLSASANIYAKERAIVAGLEEIIPFYQKQSLDVITSFKDGDEINKGDKLLTITGNAKDLLLTERVALNYLQVISGIATNTKKYVESISKINEDREQKTYLAATRKTWADEWIEKKGVLVGGGLTHRLGLDGFYMLKDNHISFLDQNGKSLKDTLNSIFSNPSIYARKKAVVVEVETIEKAQEVAKIYESLGGLNSTITPCIMLDNFTPSMISKVIDSIKCHALIEASGIKELKELKDYALTGVDVISTSKLQRESSPTDYSQKISLN